MLGLQDWIGKGGGLGEGEDKEGWKVEEEVGTVWSFYPWEEEQKKKNAHKAETLTVEKPTLPLFLSLSAYYVLIFQPQWPGRLGMEADCNCCVS